MDERPDLVRSVTDGRYVYLRNYFPHVSQAQHVSYQFETPTTRIWREWFDAGRTNEAQSVFWTAPRDPEELYDLESDSDEVRNLAGSPEHQQVLERLRRAQRDHAARIRDVSFLPEGEIHSRSAGKSPYDMARSEGAYPFERVFETAELASSMEMDHLPALRERLTDSDSGVRYWAALGFLMRGATGVEMGTGELRRALDDESPHVRVVAAHAMAEFGSGDDTEAALGVLRELLPPDETSVFVSIAALNAAGALGEQALPLLKTIRAMPEQGRSPHERYNSYVPRLVADLKEQLGGGAE
jgi:uncharacterized sulfatase